MSHRNQRIHWLRFFIPSLFTRRIAPSARRIHLERLETRVVLDGDHPPSIDFGSFEINEGDTLNATAIVTVTDPTPGAVITSIEISLDADFLVSYIATAGNGLIDNGGGEFEATATIDWATLVLKGIDNGSENYSEAIFVRAFDSIESDNDDETSIFVNEVLPTFMGIEIERTGIETLSSGGCGGGSNVATLSVTAADPNQLDTIAITVDWGDGNIEPFVLTPGSPQTLIAEHTYPATEFDYPIKIYVGNDFVEIEDESTFNLDDTSTFSVGGGPTDGPSVCLGDDGVLTVIDSDDNDTVTITSPAPGQVQVVSSFFSTQLFDSADVTSIVVSFGDGDDGLLVSADITTTVLAFGGAGDDAMVGGGGSNVLVGGGGTDVISGRGARDILIGGADSDLLYGSGGQDILVDGATLHDADAVALLAILAEWTTGNDSNASFQQRRDHLRGTLPGGLNGTYLLDNLSLIDNTVLDLLLSGAGTDWVLRHNGDIGF